MIEPLQRDDALLADIASVPAADPRLHVWWLGQSGFLVQAAGRRVLFDPYLSDSLTEKYAATDKPHERISRLALRPNRLTGIRWVTASHAHTDHLDAETLRPLRAANPGMKLVAPEAIRALALERSGLEGGDFAGLDAGTAWTSDGVAFHGIAAMHNAFDRDAEGRHPHLGFVVRLGGWCIYHAGDTLPYPDLAGAVRPFAPDLALLPVNGNVPARRVAGNLDGAEAAALARDIGAGCAVPCHYDLFAFNTVSPRLFEDSCRVLGVPHRVLRIGERLTLEKAAA